jgi:serine/threonine-protein kinase
MALVTKHITELAPPLKTVSKFVPARFAEAIDRCLAKDPKERFASCGELAEAIADAQVTRKVIAPSVHEFLSAVKYGTVQVTAIAALWMFLGVTGVPESGILGWIMIAVLVAVTPLVLAHPVLAARGVVRAGLDQRHVAEAVTFSSKIRDANIEYEVARAQYLANGLSSIWVRPVFVVWAAVVAFLIPSISRDLIYAGFDLEGLGILIFLIAMGSSGAFCLGMTIVPKQTVAILTRGTPENAGFLRRFWAGSIGRWFFRLAGIGLKRAKVVPALAPQPTETLIGSATTLLFKELPKEQRARLGDVPDVIGRLERAAATLRARRDELQQALADVGSQAGSTKREQFIAELETVRERVEGRLATAVAAMENLRLDLLRLRAGVGTPEDLTIAIEEARLVGEAVDAELAAHKEVEAVT